MSRYPFLGKREMRPKGAPLPDDKMVTVCDACMRACCWQGEFMCDYADMAGTVERTVAQLRAGRHGENESYWRFEPSA